MSGNDTRPNAKRHSVHTGHGDSVYALKVSTLRDRPGLLSSGGDGHLVRWSLEDGNTNGELIAKLGGSVYALCPLADGSGILAGCNHSGIFHLQPGMHEPGYLPMEAVFHDLTEAPDGRIYAATDKGELLSINASRMEVLTQMQVTTMSLRTLAVHPHEPLLATGSSDKMIRVYSIRDDQPELVSEWEAHEHSVFTLAFSPDGRHLLSGSRDASIRRWDVANQFSANGSVNAHLFAIHQVSFSPDGEHFLTCSMDKTIKLWSSASLGLLRVIDRARHDGHRNSVNRVLWLDADHFASAGDDRSIMTWQVTFP